ncbi:MAG: zinc metalloprotease [Acidobacteriaceae bacterium]|jgi:hypothetical protein|nr:zinc metalloprotease [Acidobacteriaceae bacterium]
MADETPRRICGTQNAHMRLLATDPEYVAARGRIENHALEFARTSPAGRSGITLIPVVVHVVYNTPAQNISDAQINSQIDVLNQDFRKANADLASLPAVFAPLAADARIEFKLADKDPSNNPTTGITRTQTATASFSDDDKVKSAATGGHAAWNRDKFLNVWVCPLSGGLLGYAQFPGGPAATDGVVINCTAFGTNGIAAAPFNLGRTATHEVGHFLNLRHIWGDDGTGCNGSDFVGDTPNQAGPNYGAPAFPHVTCGNGPHGDLFMNYMDYVDDRAMFMFTAGQVTRMQACLDGPRATLGTPKPNPTLKFIDDPGPSLKFRDDVTLKFADDATLKFRDDITFKFSDDATLKFRDDGGGKLKVVDDPIATLAGGDPIGPGDPFGPVVNPGVNIGGGRGAQPFILSTPHHSMAWGRSFPEAFQAQVSQYEQQIAQAEQLLAQCQQAEQAGALTDADRQQANQIYEEYQRIVGEYQRMIHGQ